MSGKLMELLKSIVLKAVVLNAFIATSIFIAGFVLGFTFTDEFGIILFLSIAAGTGIGFIYAVEVWFVAVAGLRANRHKGACLLALMISAPPFVLPLIVIFSAISSHEEERKEDKPGSLVSEFSGDGSSSFSPPMSAAISTKSGLAAVSYGRKLAQSAGGSSRWEESEIRVYRYPDGSFIRKFDIGPENAAYGLAFQPSGGLLLSSIGEKAVIWNTEEGGIFREFVVESTCVKKEEELRFRPPPPARGAIFVDDDTLQVNQLVHCGLKGAYYIFVQFDINTGKEIARVEDPSVCALWAMDSGQVAVRGILSKEPAASIYDCSEDRLVREIFMVPGRGSPAEVAVGEQNVYVISTDSTTVFLNVWDWRKSIYIDSKELIPPPRGGMQGIKVDDAASYIAIGSGSRDVRTWDLQSGEMVLDAQGDYPLAFDKVNDYLLVSYGRTPVLYKLQR